MTKLKFLCLVIFCSLSFAITAQVPLSTTGKMHLKYLSGYMHKLKTTDPNKNAMEFQKALQNAKQSLASLKQSDPNYDVSEMEKELSTYSTTAPAVDETSYDFIRLKSLEYKKLYESEYAFIHSTRGNQNPIPVKGTEYLLVAQAFEYEKTKTAVQNYLLKDPKNNYTLNFQKDLLNYGNYIKYSGILTHANKLSEQAYELSIKKETPAAIESAQQAIGYCKGVLLLSPGHAGAMESLKVAEKALSAVSASVGKAFTGEFHKTHVNQIVWSKQPLSIGNENIADVLGTFTAGETIYGTLYLSDKISNLIDNSNKKLSIEIFINQENMHFYDPYIAILPSNREQSYLQFTLVPSEQYDYTNDIKNENNTILDFNQTMLRKAPFTHTIGVRVDIHKTKEIVFGQFKYDISAGTTKNEQVVKKIEALQMELARLPKANMTDAALVNKMTELMNNNSDGIKYSLGRIVSNGWSINKNSLDIIIDRSISAFFLATFPDGHCEYVGHTFSQAYAGAGTYATKLTVIQSPFKHGKMNCANAHQ